VKQNFIDGQATVEPYGQLFELRGTPLSRRSEFASEMDGVYSITFAGCVAPFYYAIDMRRRGKVPKDMPPAWMVAVLNGALSFSYNAVEGVLYVSNTLGASYGLPPTARHLQLKKLVHAVQQCGLDHDAQSAVRRERVVSERDVETTGEKKEANSDSSQLSGLNRTGV